MNIHTHVHNDMYTSNYKSKTIHSRTVLGFTRAQGETGGESFLEPKEAFLMIGACSSLAVL